MRSSPPVVSSPPLDREEPDDRGISRTFDGLPGGNGNATGNLPRKFQANTRSSIPLPTPPSNASPRAGRALLFSTEIGGDAAVRKCCKTLARLAKARREESNRTN